MKKTEERKLAEEELLLYLQLYTELRGRYGTAESLAFFAEEIDKIVEKIKKM